MESIWQFSKVYPKVDATTQRKSRYENVIVWDHPSEIHLIDPARPATVDNLTPAYWAWRHKGFSAPYAVRYPPGYGKMANCIGLLMETATGIEGPFDYVEARKRLYVPLYTRLARQSPLFAELRRMRERGQNLLIAEVDGPHQESLGYYMQTCGAGADFIIHNTVAARTDELRLLLNDPKHPFGHGYCLAAALADIDLLAEPELAPGAAANATFADITDADVDAMLGALTVTSGEAEFHLTPRPK